MSRAVVLLLAVPLMLAGCADRPGIDPAFIGRTETVCRDFNTAWVRLTGGSPPYTGFDPQHPDPARLPGLGEYYTRGLPARRALPGKLEALGEPATGREMWDRLRDAGERLNQVAIEQAAAAVSGNASAFTATANTIHQLSRQLHDDGHKAGFGDHSPCDDTF
jgi:hypothetical protein